MPELVSAIITTHKRPPNILKRAIDSVYNQTYQHFEVFVIDDAPEYICHKEIENLIQQYDKRLKYLINMGTKGACSSRNLGIRAAHGAYIALLDDDDVWLPYKLEIMLPLFTKEIGLVYAPYNIYKPHKRLVVKRPPIPYQGNIFKELLTYRNFIGGCSVPILRRKDVLDVGLFDESFRSAQDYDLWLRLAKHCSVAYCERPVVNYYLSTDAISNNPQKKIESSKKLLNKYQEDFQKYPRANKNMNLGILYSYFYGDNILSGFSFYKQLKDISFFDFLYLLIKGNLKRILLILHLHSR